MEPTLAEAQESIAELTTKITELKSALKFAHERMAYYETQWSDQRRITRETAYHKDAIIRELRDIISKAINNNRE